MVYDRRVFSFIRLFYSSYLTCKIKDDRFLASSMVLSLTAVGEKRTHNIMSSMQMQLQINIRNGVNTKGSF